MARKDDITKKSALSGNNRSNALNITKRKWNLNLIKCTLKDGKKVRVSMKTYKTLKKKNQLG